MTSFASTPNGDVLIADGVGPVLRFSTSYQQANEAGVPAPSTACTVAGSGIGRIVGKYRAYVRFLDRDGNPGNLSPVSDEVEPYSTSGTITNVDAFGVITVTSSGHGLGTGARVKIKDVTGLDEANGTWTITVVDVDTFTLDDSSASGYYTGGGTWKAGVETITYTNVPTTDDPRVVRRQILRNTDGQGVVYYVDIDTYDLALTTFESTKAGSTLSARPAVPIFDVTGVDLAQFRYSTPPSNKEVLAYQLGRMFLSVDATVSRGTVAVTSGSKTVTGANTNWAQGLEGRYLTIRGHRKQYLIDTVNVSSQTLTLTEEYAGATSPYAFYAIGSSPAERKIVYFSESGLPLAWPPWNGISVVEDGDDITALCPSSSFLYILERKHVYRSTFKSGPNADGFVFPDLVGRGCISNRCWKEVGDAVYMLDECGVHSFTGGSSESISDVIGEIFEDNGSLGWGVDWGKADRFFCVHSEQQEVVRWFVCLKGHSRPRHAICYGYRLKRWWMEEYFMPVGAATEARINGKRTVILGGWNANVYEMHGNLDGVGASGAGTVTSSTLVTLSDSTRTFTSDLVGCPVTISAGKGRFQTRRIIAVSGNSITVSHPWTTLPDTTSTYQIGGVNWRWKTGWLDYLPIEDSNVRRLEWRWKRVDEGSMVGRVYEDYSDDPVAWEALYETGMGNGVSNEQDSPDLVVDLTRTNGHAQRRIDGHRELYADGYRSIATELKGTTGNQRLTIMQVGVDGVTGAE